MNNINSNSLMGGILSSSRSNTRSSKGGITSGLLPSLSNNPSSYASNNINTENSGISSLGSNEVLGSKFNRQEYAETFGVGFNSMTNSISSMSQHITNAITQQTRDLIEKGFNKIVESVGELHKTVQKLAEDKLIYAKEEQNWDTRLEKYQKALETGFSGVVIGHVQDLFSQIMKPFESKGFKEELTKYVFETFKPISKFFGIDTDMPYHDNANKPVAFTEKVQNAILYSYDLLKSIEKYNRGIYETLDSSRKFRPEYIDEQINFRNQTLSYQNTVIKGMDIFKDILLDIRLQFDPILDDINKKKDQFKSNLKAQFEMNVALEKIKIDNSSASVNEKDKLNKTLDSLLTLQSNRQSGNAEQNTKTLSLKSILGNFNDQKIFSNVTKNNNLEKLKREKAISLGTISLSKNFDDLNNTIKQQITATLKNTKSTELLAEKNQDLSDISKGLATEINQGQKTTFSSLLHTAFSIFSEPLNILKGIVPAFTFFAKWGAIYKAADWAIGMGRKGINYISDIELGKSSDGINKTVGSVAHSAWSGLTSFVDPLVSGIRTIFKDFIGEDTFNRISDILGATKEWVGNLWTGLFGPDEERSVAREKLFTPIKLGFKEVTEKYILPALWKGYMIYRGSQGLLDPVNTFRNISDNLRALGSADKLQKIQTRRSASQLANQWIRTNGVDDDFVMSQVAGSKGTDSYQLNRLAASIYKKRTNFLPDKNGGFMTTLGRMGSGISGMFGRVFNLIPVIGQIMGLIQTISLLSTGFNKLKEWYNSSGEGGFSGFVKENVTKFFSTASSTFVEMVPIAAKAVWEGAKGIWSGTMDFLKVEGFKAIDAIWDAGVWMWHNLLDVFTSSLFKVLSHIPLIGRFFTPNEQANALSSDLINPNSVQASSTSKNMTEQEQKSWYQTWWGKGLLGAGALGLSVFSGGTAIPFLAGLTGSMLAGSAAKDFGTDVMGMSDENAELLGNVVGIASGGLGGVGRHFAKKAGLVGVKSIAGKLIGKEVAKGVAKETAKQAAVQTGGQMLLPGLEEVGTVVAKEGVKEATKEVAKSGIGSAVKGVGMAMLHHPIKTALGITAGSTVVNSYLTHKENEKILNENPWLAGGRGALFTSLGSDMRNGLKYNEFKSKIDNYSKEFNEALSIGKEKGYDAETMKSLEDGLNTLKVLGENKEYYENLQGWLNNPNGITLGQVTANRFRLSKENDVYTNALKVFEAIKKDIKDKKDKAEKEKSDKLKEQQDKLKEQQDKEIAGGVSSLGQLSQWIQNGTAKRWIGEQITKLGDSIKGAWNFLKNQDYKKMFGSAMEVFGGVSGNIMSAIFGEEKAEKWLTSAMKYTDNTNVKRFLSGARSSILSNVSNIADYAAKTNRSVEDIQKLLREDWDRNGVPEENRKMPGGNTNYDSGVSQGLYNYVPVNEKSNQFTKALGEKTVKTYQQLAQKNAGIQIFDENGKIDITKLDTSNKQLSYGFALTRLGEGDGINKKEQFWGSSDKTRKFHSRNGIYAAALGKYANESGYNMPKELRDQVQKVVGKSTKTDYTWDSKEVQGLNEILGKQDNLQFINQLAKNVYEKDYYNNVKNWPIPVRYILADTRYQHGNDNFLVNYTAKVLGYNKPIDKVNKLNSDARRFVFDKATKSPWDVASVMNSVRLTVTEYGGRVQKIAAGLGFTQNERVFSHEKNTGIEGFSNLNWMNQATKYNLGSINALTAEALRHNSIVTSYGAIRNKKGNLERKANTLRKDEYGKWSGSSMDCSQYVGTVLNNLGFNKFMNRGNVFTSSQMLAYFRDSRNGFIPKFNASELAPGDVLFNVKTSKNVGQARERKDRRINDAVHVALLIPGRNGGLEVSEATGNGDTGAGGIRQVSLDKWLKRSESKGYKLEAYSMYGLNSYLPNSPSALTSEQLQQQMSQQDVVNKLPFDQKYFASRYSDTGMNFGTMKRFYRNVDKKEFSKLAVRLKNDGFTAQEVERLLSTDNLNKDDLVKLDKFDKIIESLIDISDNIGNKEDRAAVLSELQQISNRNQTIIFNSSQGKQKATSQARLKSAMAKR